MPSKKTVLLKLGLLASSVFILTYFTMLLIVLYKILQDQTSNTKNNLFNNEAELTHASTNELAHSTYSPTSKKATTTITIATTANGKVDKQHNVIDDTYQVAENEGLWQIAQKLKVPTNKIKAWIINIVALNNLQLKDANGNYFVKTGTILILPKNNRTKQ